MSLPAYPTYKNSSVGWLGQVPGHWSVKRIRRIARLNPSKSEVAHLSRNVELSFLPMEAIGDDGTLALDRTRPIGDVETGYTFFRENDITIAKITPCFENGKGAIMRGLTGGAGFGTTELIVVRPNEEEVTSDYLHLFFNSLAFRQHGEASMYGAGGQKRISDDFVRDMAIPLPPVPEQNLIVRFLGKEIAKIDAMVHQQEKLLRLLQDKKQAVISTAVSKGLASGIPMKESNIEWIGRIPQHWQIVRIKNVSRLESGHTPSKQVPEYWENCTIPWVSLNDSKQLAQTDYITETAVQINELGIANSSARLLGSGAVVFTRDATIGLAAITTKPMAVSQHLIAWCPGERLNALYLLRAINAMAPFLEYFTFGATIKTIGMADVKKLVIPLPPLEEQIEIAEHIESKLKELASLRSEVQSSIDVLTERRSALITAAVTGKIDVRGFAPPQQ